MYNPIGTVLPSGLYNTMDGAYLAKAPEARAVFVLVDWRSQTISSLKALYYGLLCTMTFVGNDSPHRHEQRCYLNNT